MLTSNLLTACRAACAAIVAIGACGGIVAAQGTCFEDAIGYVAGTNPEAVALGDLDGDSHLDVVTADRGSSTVSVFLNAGNGAFAARVAHPGGNQPRHVAIGDLDGDGDQDLVVAERNGQGMSTIANHGNGTFAAPVNYNVSVFCWSVAIADLDLDGDRDILLASGGYDFQVFRNAGDGTFAPYVSYPTGIGPRTLVVADLDGDGDDDVAAANFFGDTVSVLGNHGDGTFAGQQVYDVGVNPHGIAAGDVDGDGDLDLVIANNGSGSISRLSNLGNGTFAPDVQYPAGHLVHSVRMADLDGDGDQDVLAVNGPDDRIAVLTNAGDGSFAGAAPLATGPEPMAVAVGDLDGDGDVDVAVAIRAGNGLEIIRACRTAGAPICAGDGSGTACPCANESAPGAQAGCLHSLGAGGTLRGTGAARIGGDTLVLRGAQMPESPALYFQGTSAIQGGAGAVFGDGLRCAGGTMVRLLAQQNVGGASQVPAAGDPPVSILGQVATSGERVYQVWYRNPASFCTPSTFNLTNGLRLLWTP